MQEIAVYFNSRASNGPSEIWRKEILRCLFRSNITFRQPQSLIQLEEFLESDISRKVDSIISVGGDGTANTLIQKLAGQNIAMLVVPAGTANDLASELGTKSSLQHALSQIRARQMKRMDLISVNGQFMATNGGFGFGGRVAANINEMRKRVPLFKQFMKFTGRNIYSLFAASDFLDFQYSTYKFKIESDEFSGVFEGPALLINNQKRLGGQFVVAPEADNSDGVMNITVFKHPNRMKAIQCLWALSKGKCLKEDPHFLTFTTQKMKVEILDADEEMTFFGDGEIFNSHNNKVWEIEVIPQSLLVYTMENYSSFLTYSSHVTLS